MKVLVTQFCPTLWDPWTGACQAPLSMDLPGKNTGVDCHFLLQGIFLTQGSKPGLLHLLHCHADSLPLNCLGSPPTAGQAQKRLVTKSHSLPPPGQAATIPPALITRPLGILAFLRETARMVDRNMHSEDRRQGARILSPSLTTQACFPTFKMGVMGLPWQSSD